MYMGRVFGWGKLEKRAGQIGTALADPRALYGYLRAMRAARMQGTAPATALSSVKYLGHYLTMALTPGERREAILFHHAFLSRVFPPAALQSESFIWRASSGDQDLAVAMRAAQLAPMEGEHELVFHANGHMLSTLTFAFVGGSTIGVNAPQAMVIGGVQGVPSTREEGRAAAKANGEIAPAAMLIVAARALAEAAGVTSLYGVSPEHHPAFGYAADKMTLDYERLWRDAGAVDDENGWFALFADAGERPLAEIPRSHRGRTRRKREFKLRLHDQIVDTIRTELMAPHEAARG